MYCALISFIQVCRFHGNFQQDFCASVLTLECILKQREELLDALMIAQSDLITDLSLEKAFILIFFQELSTQQVRWNESKQER